MPAQCKVAGRNLLNLPVENSIRSILYLILVICQLPLCYAEQTAIQKDTLAVELRHALGPQLLEIWYPRSIDSTKGGYLSDFSYCWEPDGKQDKMIVTQARHIWATSKASQFYDAGTTFSTAAAHGVTYLRDVMWDDQQGGFYDMVDREGHLLKNDQGKALKRAYGNAFAIFGLAAYVQATSDPEALALAQRAFHWLEKHSYDPSYGGYFQFMERDGTPLLQGFQSRPPKDQNSTIHLLEAYTELYRVWPDPLLRKRLHALLLLVRDRITTEKGYMNLFFERDWTHVSYREASAEDREAHYDLDHVTFGHDVETAFLLLDTAEALGMPEDPKTWQIAKKMVDHALQNGWDNQLGGFYDRGYYFDPAGPITIIQDTKVWWAQAESMNTLLIFADRYPDDPLQYLNKFMQLWTYIQNYLIDAEHGGWFLVGLDKAPAQRQGPKGEIWKGNYHTARSLMNCILRLESAK
jgi:mannobiose 2-epimerase